MTNIYDAIKEKEGQVANLQAQIAGLQAEIEALRVAARILDGGAAPEAARPVPVQQPVAVQQPVSVQPANGADKSKRVWP